MISFKLYLALSSAISEKSMWRILFLLGFLFCLPCLGGCLGAYYPGLDCIPKVSLETQPSEVHAFRVQTAESGFLPIATTIDPRSSRLGKWEKNSFEVLSEIPLTNPEEVPTQIRPSLNGAMVGFLPIAWWFSYASNSMALKLYRPGYELVEIKSWERAKPINWIPAPDLYSQEMILDKLLPISEVQFGWVSPAHRAALLFGAAEYDRLAAAIQSDRKELLADKAEQLRKRANVKKPSITEIFQ